MEPSPSLSIIEGPPSYYLGGVSDSLQHLPRWYQLLAAAGVLLVIYLRNSPVVSWLVIELHSSFGNEAMWVPDYKKSLQNMTLTERLCFTLYGVLLLTIVALLYRIFCQDRWNVGRSAIQLFPDKKLQTATAILGMCIVEGVRLRCQIIFSLDTEGTLANVAMHSFEDDGTGMRNSALGEQNPHFVIQFELLKSFFAYALRHRLPAILIAVSYRLLRDAPRREHVALRWYMATIAWVFMIQEAVLMYAHYSWDEWTAWTTIAWSLLYLGLVNYTYGPSKRAGKVVTISTTNCIAEAARNMITCIALWVIVSILIIALVVSIHEELIALWLFSSLSIVWFPAVVDSCSTDYMVILSCSAAYIAHGMGAVQLYGSVRFAVLLCLWWLTTSLMYNVTLISFQSRYLAIIVACWFCMWYLSPPRELMRNESSAMLLGLRDGRTLYGLLTARVVWLCRVANYDVLPVDSWLFKQADGSGQKAFYILLHRNAMVCVPLLLFTSVTWLTFSLEKRIQFQQKDMVVVTAGVLLRKFIRSFVIAWCVGCSFATWWVMRSYLLPTWASFLPDIFTKSIAGILACTILGNLMDMQDTMFDSCIRLLGLLDPPEVEDTTAGISDPSFSAVRGPIRRE